MAMFDKELPKMTTRVERVRFPILFTSAFLFLYGFNLAFIGCTTKGGYYLAWLDSHLNYIKAWRRFTIEATAGIVELFGYEVSKTEISVHVTQYGGFNLIYSCLGYGIMSLYTAFVVSYPGATKGKTRFLLTGLVLIQCLNIIRFIALALFSRPKESQWADHHLIFNICIYLVLAAKIYWWIKKSITNQKPHSDAEYTIT
jgi:exosortase/archaeosortase family protein